MRKISFLLTALVITGALVSGCANPTKKLGRGMRNVMEPLRMGEVRRSMEQTSLLDGADTAYTTGFIRGVNKTFARTGLGLYEIVTAPIPPYDPQWTTYLKPEPVYPESYKPSLVEDSSFSTDTNLGFGGGDVFPLLPGNRFRIFDTH